MASLAESASMASLPMVDIQALQKQLMNNNLVIADATSMIPRGDAPLVNDSWRGGSIAETPGEAVQQQEQNAFEPPILRPTRSEPSPQIEEMVSRASQQRLMATFHGDPGGDTQVMDTQVYDGFHKADRGVLATPIRPVTVIESTTGGKSLDEDTYTNLAPTNGVKSMIDLIADYPDHVSQDAQSNVSDDMESLLASPQTQMQRNAPHQRSFAETPQLAGHKRSSDGQFVPSAAKSAQTPGYEALFGPAKTPDFSTTQLFQKTQAISSPVPDGLRSDPVQTRPSPNLQDDPVLTSHPGYSSPIIARSAAASSIYEEPRNKYVSMRESQDRRAQHRRADLHSVIEEEEDEVLLDQYLMRVREKRAQKERRDQVLPQVRQISAPARPSSSAQYARFTGAEDPSVIRPYMINRHTNGNMSSPPRPPPDESDIGGMQPHEAVDEHLPEYPDEASEHADDEYDEFTSTVLRSQAEVEVHTIDDDETDDDDDIEEGTKNHHDQQMQHNMTHPSTAGEVIPGSQMIQHGPGPVFHTTQPTSLLGSQTIPQSEKRSLLSTTNHNPSSITSVIPGSQYAVATSQQLAKQPQPWSRSQPVSNSKPGLDKQASRVPSSPPLPDPIDDAASEGHQESPTRATDVREDALADNSRPEIAESDAVVNGSTADTTTRPTHESGSNQAFVSANTHLSPLKPRVGSQSMPSGVSQDSTSTPLKRAGVLTFHDIAAIQTQPSGGLDVFEDVNDLLDGLNAKGDEQYRQMVLSPSTPQPRKRRKLERTVQSSAPAALAEADTETSMLDVVDEREVAEDAADQHDKPRSQANLVETSLHEHRLDNENQEGPPDTPTSVKRREAAGSAAVSQLIAVRSTSHEQSAKLSGPGKRTYSRKDRQRHKQQNLVDTVNEAAQPQDEVNKPEQDEAMTGHEEGSNAINPALPTTAPLAQDEHVIRTMPVTHPDRVLALFRGQPANYYPATIAKHPSPPGYTHVHFDDGSESTVKNLEAIPLDLHIGDLVQVDLVNMRKVWVVQGFERDDDATDSQSGSVDVRGHTAILVTAKLAKQKTGESSGAIVKVKIANIYLAVRLSAAYRGRSLALPIDIERKDEPATPVRTTTTSSISTPRSRSGRQAARKQRYIPPSSSPITVDIPQAPLAPRAKGVFSNMAFAITLPDDAGPQKQNLVLELRRNGGMILEEGFENLFEASDVLQKKATTNDNTDTIEGTHTLTLKPQYASLGFVAVIANRPLSTPKYMQALGLGLPTLSPRWVEDMVSMSRKASNPAARNLPWTKYLLPAGDSSYLGTLRSRTLTAYSTLDIMFQDVIAERELLFNGDKVLIVVPQKGRDTSSWGKRKHLAFLTIAMGAGSIRRVADLAEADSIVLSDKTWKWLLVDGDNIDEAVRYITSLNDGVAATKKRKRPSDAPSKQKGKLFQKSYDSDFTIINKDYIKESLILGTLLE